MRRVLIGLSGSLAVCIGASGGAAAQTAGSPDPKAIETGSEVYKEHCAACHGDDLVSTGQNPDLRQLRASDRSRYQTVVEKGKGQMPPWKGVVTDAEIDAIWAYIMARGG